MSDVGGFAQGFGQFFNAANMLTVQKNKTELKQQALENKIAGVKLQRQLFTTMEGIAKNNKGRPKQAAALFDTFANMVGMDVNEPQYKATKELLLSASIDQINSLKSSMSKQFKGLSADEISGAIKGAMGDPTKTMEVLSGMQESQGRQKTEEDLRTAVGTETDPLKIAQRSLPVIRDRMLAAVGRGDTKAIGNLTTMADRAFSGFGPEAKSAGGKVLADIIGAAASGNVNVATSLLGERTTKLAKGKVDLANAGKRGKKIDADTSLARQRTATEKVRRGKLETEAEIKNKVAKATSQKIRQEAEKRRQEIKKNELSIAKSEREKALVRKKHKAEDLRIQKAEVELKRSIRKSTKEELGLELSVSQTAALATNGTTGNPKVDARLQKLNPSKTLKQIGQEYAKNRRSATGISALFGHLLGNQSPTSGQLPPTLPGQNPPEQAKPLETLRAPTDDEKAQIADTLKQGGDKEKMRLLLKNSGIDSTGLLD